MRDPERTTCRCLSTSIRPQRYQVLDLVQLGIDDLQRFSVELICIGALDARSGAKDVTMIVDEHSPAALPGAGPGAAGHR